MISATFRNRLLPALARVTPRPPPAGSGRALILQPDHLGDILLSEPAVRFLRHKLPSAELIAVVGPWSSEITHMAWPVDRIVEVEFPGFTRFNGQARRIEPYGLLQREIPNLRALEADDALILRDDAWWSAWLARGAVGGNVVTSSDRRTSPFATIIAHSEQSIHRTALALEVVTTYLGRLAREALHDVEWDMSPQLRPDWREVGEPAAAFDTRTTDRPLVVVHPGSGAPVKSWPTRSWRTVLRELSDTSIVISGSARERELCDALGGGLPHVRVVAGETSLPQLAALLRRADLAIGADNGPMHLAGAVGTPTLRLFGPSDPDRYGPWPGTARQVVLTAGWSCPRCEDLSPERKAGCGCMAALAPSQVVDEVRKLLADAA